MLDSNRRRVVKVILKVIFSCSLETIKEASAPRDINLIKTKEKFTSLLNILGDVKKAVASKSTSL